VIRKTPLALAMGLAGAVAPMLPLSAWAQAASTTAAAALDAPLPLVTVTATRTERAVDNVPATVTVLPAKRIEQSGARDIKDLLNDELDLTVRQQATRFNASGGTARAGNEGVNIRGLEGNQVMMLVDGVRTPAGFTFGPIGTGRGDFLVLDTAQSVEVLRGPASTQYGSDGLAGVVSLRTLDPADLLKKGQTFGGFARAGYNSVDDSWAATLGLAGREGLDGRWQGLLLLTTRRGHETDNQGSVDTQDGTRTTPNPVSYRAPAVLAKVSYALAPEHELGLSFESQQRKQDTEVYSARGDVSSRGTTTTTTDLDAHDKLDRQRVSLEHRFDDEVGSWLQRARSQVYWQDATTHQLTLAERTLTTAGVSSDSPQSRDYDYEQKLLGFSTQLESTVATPALGQDARQRFSYGLDWSQAKVNGEFTSITPPKLFPDTTYTLAGAFVQDEIEAGPISIIPGLRFDSYKLSASQTGYTGTAVSLSDQAATPRLGAIWRADEAFAPYVNWARGFRAPTPDQVNSSFANPAQFYSSIGNPDLKAERANSVELGLRGRVRGAWGELRYQVLHYDNRYDDFISQQVVSGTGAPTDPLVFQYINLSKARILGSEARAEWHRSGWVLNGGVAISHGRSEADGVKTPLDTVEPARSTLGLRYEAADWTLRASALHLQGKARSEISSATYYAPTGYTTLDLGGSWKPLPALTLQANVSNLFDRHYTRWSDVRGLADSSTVKDAYTAPGRSVQVAARYDF